MTDALIPFGEIIDLAEVRIQRGYDSRPSEKCKHLNLRYENSLNSRRIWCVDCEKDVDPFDAFLVFANHFHSMLGSAKNMQRKAQEAMKVTARLRAVKALDKAWSGNVMAIDCPHCGGGLLPEDFSDGRLGQQSRELEIARRAKKKDPLK